MTAMEITKEILKDRCVVLRRSEGSYGPVFTPAAEVACYVEEGSKKVAGPQGEDVIAGMMLIIPPSVSVSAGDRVEFNGRQYDVIRVDAPRPGGKTHHLEVYTGEAV